MSDTDSDDFFGDEDFDDDFDDFGEYSSEETDVSVPVKSKNQEEDAAASLKVAEAIAKEKAGTVPVSMLYAQ